MKSYKELEYIIDKNEIGGYRAYIRLPDEHPYIEMLLNLDYDSVMLEVHGGLTFAQHIDKGRGGTQGFTPGFWVGWEYGHRGVENPEDEIEWECRYAIEQLTDSVKLRN